MRQTTNININIDRPYMPVVVYAKQYDANTRWIYAKLYTEGAQYTIPQTAMATVTMSKPDGTVYYADAIISDNTVQIQLLQEALSAAGKAKTDVVLYDGGGERLTAFSFDVIIEASVDVGGYTISADYMQALIAASTQIVSTGTALKIKGYYDSVEDLQTAVTTPSGGDMYAVGVAAPYNIYIYDAVSETWRDNGSLGACLIPYAGVSSGTASALTLAYDTTLVAGTAFLFVSHVEVSANATLQIADTPAYPLIMRDGSQITAHALHENIPTMVVFRTTPSAAYVVAWDGRTKMSDFENDLNFVSVDIVGHALVIR